MFRHSECDQILERSSVSPRRRPATYVGRTRAIVLVILGGICLLSVMLFIQRAHAEAYVSTQSGSWNDSNTWGGAGVPDSSDDVVISNGHTVTLGTTCFSRDLTISLGGTLDLNGQQFNFPTNGATFTNNGLLTNGGVTNTFYFHGNNTPGAVTQSFGGTGTYGGNVRLRLIYSVVVNVAASTSLTFDSATNILNLDVDPGSTLNLPNALDLFGPAIGAGTVGFRNQGTTAGVGLRTHGNVLIDGAAGIGSPVELVSGAQTGRGTFNGAFTVDNGASFKLVSTVDFYNHLTNPGGATVDLNGQQINFRGDGATFANSGLLTNSAAANAFIFHGTGTAGAVTQNFAGTGTYSGNVQLRLIWKVIVNASVSTSLTFSSSTNGPNLTVDGDSTLNLPDALSVIAPAFGADYVGVVNSGVISGAGVLRTYGNVRISGNAAIGAPVEIASGAQQGSGSFSGAVTIDSDASLKLVGVLSPYANLTVQSNGTLDLNGQQINFRADGATFANNGNLTNSAVAFNTFYFHGNGTQGAITQSLAGAGSYGSNLQLRLYNKVVVNAAAGTSLDGLLSLVVDTGSTLNLPYPLTLAGPSSGPTFATVTNDGTISGNGGLNTQGQVQLNSGGSFDTPLEVVNGITQSAGNFVKPITADNTATFKLTGIVTPTANLTIQSGGTLDLNGQQINFKGNGATFTNNGLLTNSGVNNTFYFHGNDTPGVVTQSLGGTGTYSGNLLLRPSHAVTVNVAAATSLTFNGATGIQNLIVDNGSTVNLANALDFTAPAGGPNYVGIANNGVLGGAGGLRTNGNVQLYGNATIGAPVEIASGAQRGSGYFSGIFTIDSGASLNLSGLLVLSGNLTLQSGATLDLGGQQINFVGNGTTLTNNGTLTNTAGGNNVYFHGNGVTGAITQTLQGSGAFTGNVRAQLYNRVSVSLGSDVQLVDLVMDSFTTLNLTGHTLKLSGAGTPMSAGGTLITTGSTIAYNGTAPQSVATTNVNYHSLTVDNPAGVTLGAPKTIAPGATLTLNQGTFNIGSNLTMGNDTSIKRDAGALSGPPTFGASVNVEYRGTVAVTTGAEIPASASTLNNLTDNKAGTVALGGNATVNGLLALNSGTLAVGVNTLTLNNGTSLSGGALTSSATGMVTYNQASNGQSVLAGGYGNLTFNNYGKTFPTTGVVSIAGTFDPGIAEHTTIGSTIEYNGTTHQVLPTTFLTYDTLYLTNEAGITSTTHISVVTILWVKAGTFISSSIYHDVQIDPGATLAAAAGSTINVSGDWTNNGSFTANDGIVVFDGSETQSIGGASATTFNNLTIDNAAGVTLAANVNVNGSLSLTSGTLTTNANMLALGSAASSNRTSGYVNGNLRKSFTGAAAFTYAVGTVNGYSPVGATITGGAGELTVDAVQGPQPNVGLPSKALQRYWSLAGSGITADLTFNYLDPEDIPPTATESAFHLYKYSGTFTDLGAAGLDAPNNKYTITGVSSFSDWTLAEVGAPTEITFEGFTATGVVDAKNRDVGTLLEWQTGMEVSNLGFYIHREEGGKFSRVTKDIIAGSALFAGARVVLTSGRSYSWLDPKPLGADTRFWLEEVDLSGASRMYGPFFVASLKVTQASLNQRGNSALISEVGKRQGNEDGRTPSVQGVAEMPRSGDGRMQALAKPINQVRPGAVKVGVTHEGWYRVNQPELVRAGIDPKVDPRLLQLSADGVEQPIKVTGEQDGVFDPDDAIEFYGIGINSPYSATRAYWITVGAQAGRRIAELEGPGGSAAASSFPYTIERRDRTLYFSGLRNGDRENFFGAVVSSSEVNQTLTATRIAREPGAMAELEVALQGVTAGPHLARVQLNGVELEHVSFSGQGRGVKKISITESMLSEGQNVVTLTALGGDGDVSLVDYLRLTYPRTRVADNDWLASTAWANQRVTVEGFSNDQIRVVDVTNANEPVELKARVVSAGSRYSAVVSAEGEGERRLLAFTTQRVEEVSATARQLSNWKDYSEGADYVIITRREFVDSLKPLAALRQSDGLRVAMIDVEDLYDEFNYGQKTPYAVRDFLAHARAGWKTSPRYVLLAGDASYDPKNYLGFGDSDLVPTKLIDTTYLETGSDDWFVDWNGDGAAEIAIGRLPFRARFEADVIVSKIIGYERTASSQKALLIADNNDGFDFEKATDQLLAYLPANIKPQQIYRGRLDPLAAKTQLLEAINRGQKIVNYMGHGSTNQWRGSLFTGDDARALTNANRLPFFVMMTCLNGYFHDPAMDSLSESLVRAEHGGAIAVWASTGLTLPEAQSVINQKLLSLIFEKRIKGQPLTIGEAVRLAKPAVNDTFVRSTWNLIGDPATRLR